MAVAKTSPPCLRGIRTVQTDDCASYVAEVQWQADVFAERRVEAAEWSKPSFKAIRRLEVIRQEVLMHPTGEKDGFTREAIKKSKEKKAQMEVEEKSKKPNTEPIPSKTKPKETKSSPTSSDEEAEKEKKKGEFVIVVRKSQSSGAQQSKKSKSEPALTDRPKRGRKLRTELDEELESDKVEERSIPKDLYNILDARRLNASRVHKEMNEHELINISACISQEEVDRLVEQANNKEFIRKKGVNKIMIGRVEEVIKEIEEMWKRFLKNNQGETQTKADPEVWANITLDAKDSQNPQADKGNPKMVEGKVEEAKETPKDVTAPSGDTSAKVEGKEESEKDKV
ncbi:uncharacterized protein LOC131073083 [Cryptomeria japonica]|uniref:uncharacterized protein LOC131073083 n=1 Tax=Cryptomeria japonica TaxID=3369 RepID=UPI0027DAA8B7|nr:uncharacterized protein LOC131073083 [Cryptomeria japonica]